MGNELKKKYGLITAICMVVGIVIGSGVFFKAEVILKATQGSMWLSILSWLIGGAIMIFCAYTFSILAGKHEKINGLVDYAENAMGEKYGYAVGWFLSTAYYPTLTVALAWLTARYTCVLVTETSAYNWSIVGPECMLLTAAFLILSYAINTFSPIIAGKVQVSATVIKLIPLLLMAVGGLIYGLINGITVENFSHTITKTTEGFIMSTDGVVNPAKAVFTAVCATSFAYEGWIIATSINSELKNSKKNLPIALVLGTLIIVAVYILYYVGLAGGASSATMANNGQSGAMTAFSNVFGRAFGTILFVFLIISCFGTLNGLMLGCCRGMYSIAARNLGPSPRLFSQVDKRSNMPTNSSTLGLLLCILWMVYFFGASLDETWFAFGNSGLAFNFDMTELPIITLYAFYIPIFIVMIVRGAKSPEAKKGFSNIFNNFIAPSISICGCIFMIIASIVAHRMGALWYIILFAVIMAIGLFFLFRKKSAKSLDAETEESAG